MNSYRETTSAYLATVRWVSILTIFLVCLSCNRAGGSGLIGSWRQVNGPDTITFRQDGSFAATMMGGFSGSKHFDLTGTYFVEGDKLSLTYKNGTENMTCTMKMDGSEMTITYDQGAFVKMDRSMAKFKRL